MVFKIGDDTSTDDLRVMMKDCFVMQKGAFIVSSAVPYWALDVAFAKLCEVFWQDGRSVIAFEDGPGTSQINSKIEHWRFNSQDGPDVLYKAIESSPDVIAFPMIRDRETLRAALQFAEQGVALCGFHQISVAGVSNRVADMGEDLSKYEALQKVFIEKS
ncbi:MAG: hypothetical protein HRT45_18315 [Bdellovibrionales bacterium]|nr:hypothetical protein [Bdellovibrionales bacterium]